MKRTDKESQPNKKTLPKIESCILSLVMPSRFQAHIVFHYGRSWNRVNEIAGLIKLTGRDITDIRANKIGQELATII